MNKQVGIVIVMVVAMMYFMVSIVRHFMANSEAIKEQEKATKDSLLNVQVQNLIQSNLVLKEAVHSHELQIDQLKTKLDHVNYKVNLIVN